MDEKSTVIRGILRRRLTRHGAPELHDNVPRSASRVDPRLIAAIGAAKVAGFASRTLGVGGGTALPGVLAVRIDSGFIPKLAAELPRGTFLVTGTNGKTTTSRLLASALKISGWNPIHNRSGANLASGLSTALVERVNLLGHGSGDCALFEVDEAMLPAVEAATHPRLIVLTNLFRDQLDRYGEVDHVASLWRAVLLRLPGSATVVANADDPAVAALVGQTPAKVVTFGVDTARSGAGLDHFADSKDCPLCGTPLVYEAVQYAHLGTYHCPRGDFRRPGPTLRATAVTTRGFDGTDIQVSGPFGERHWSFGLPGLYNAYNALAAAAAALALGLPVTAIEEAMCGFRAAFGRLERIQIGSQSLFVALIKNPVGFTEVLRTIVAVPGDKDFAIFINDNLADGTDVSWLWDADVELITGQCRSIVVGGSRAGDMAVRLKYAGVPENRIRLAETIAGGIDTGLSAIDDGGTLYVLPTYTAMLELRQIIGRRGYASHFWEQ